MNDYPKPYPCCVHCRADEQGSHQNPCGYRGCTGSTGAPVRARRRTAILLAVAVVVFVVGMVVAPGGVL